MDHRISVSIRSNDPTLLDLFLSITASDHAFDQAPAGEYRYSIEVLPNKASGHCYFVAAGRRSVFVAASRAEALAWLESDLHGKMAAGNAFVHAGVIGWNGAALLLPGATLTGKNAFLMEFLRCGARPIFDEYVVIDGSGLVRGFPPGLPPRSPQRLQRASRANVKRISSLNEPLSLDAVLFSKYVLGARPELQQLTPGQAFLALLKSTVAPRRNPCGVLLSLSRLAKTVPAFRTLSSELPAPTPIVGLLEQFRGGHAPAVMDLEA